MVGVATAAACALSLISGALRYYSLARIEDLLEADEVRFNEVKEFLEDDEQLILSVTVLRGLLATGGMVALTGALIGEAQLAVGFESLTTTGWLLLGGKATLLGALCFVVGKTAPASVGEGGAEAIVLRLMGPIRFLDGVLSPLTWFVAGVSTVMRRVFDVDEVDDKEEAKHEILSAALEGKSEGVIDEATLDVIEKLIDFRDIDVTEVMTPRIDICTVEADASVDDMLEAALSSEMSRLPVIDGSVDKIVGILMVKDLLRALKDSSVEPKSLFRTPLYTPETKRVADLLKELRVKKVHMAIVADEYGGTAGLVTIEDLIEEIIGEIEDEHDKEERPPLQRISDTLLDVDAKYHIDTLNEEFGTKVPEDDDVETLGGFMALKLGRIPQVGDRIDVNGTSFVITEGDERRAARVQVRLTA